MSVAMCLQSHIAMDRAESFLCFFLVRPLSVGTPWLFSFFWKYLSVFFRFLFAFLVMAGAGVGECGRGGFEIFIRGHSRVKTQDRWPDNLAGDLAL